MALKKKPVTGMKDMMPKEMEVRDYEMCIRDRVTEKKASGR